MLSQTIINKDGIAIYTDSLIPAEKSELFLLQLSKNIQWKNDESVIFGKHYITRRKTAWYGDRPCLLYTSPSPRDAHESRMPSSA